MRNIWYMVSLVVLLWSQDLWAEEYIDMDKYEYKVGEHIYVQVEGLREDKEYWLGVYHKSSSNHWTNVVSWPLVDDIANGSIKVESIKESGQYEARLFYKGTYKLIDRVEFSGIGGTKPDCGTPWYTASLTHYASYPRKNSKECKKYNGCKWAGQFYGLDGKRSKKWVKQHNIVAVHMKDWGWLGLKTIRIRKGSKEIMATVYDVCADSDCDGCCTRNLGENDFLIDMEKYTKKRFGAGSGTVQFQVCK